MSNQPKRSTDVSQSDVPKNVAARSRAEKGADDRRPMPGETAKASDSVPTFDGPFRELPMKFGRYEIQKELGKGQMGAVYLAQDTELDRPVALKVARTSSSGSTKLLKRMEVEAKAAAIVDHPLICKVYDTGEIDGIRFIAMQYVEGENLKQYMKRVGRRLKPKEVVGIVIQILEALEAAHEKGIIHRDLKPENVMLNKQRQPVIMDFGLARRTIGSTDAGLTQGMILGTAAYMSPEQATGADAIDQRSDIYAVGVMLFEMLTGDWPFTGSAIEVMGGKCLQEPPSPLERNPDLPSELAAICHKMVAKRKEDRFASCDEILNALAIYWSVPSIAKPVADHDSLPTPFEFLSGELVGTRSRLISKSGPVIRKQGLSNSTVWCKTSWLLVPKWVLVVCLLSGIIIAVTTLSYLGVLLPAQGTLSLEIGDPNLSVLFDGSPVAIVDGQPTIHSTSSVPHTLDVFYEGKKFEPATRQLTLKKGLNPTIKIAFVDGHIEIDNLRIEPAKPEPLKLSVNETIDLLKMVRFPDHAVLGPWNHVNQKIVGEPFYNSRFMVPVSLSGSYTLTCSFTRLEGNQGLDFIFPVGVSGTSFAIDQFSGQIDGLAGVGVRAYRDLIGTTAVHEKTAALANGVPHELQLTITQGSNSVAVSGMLDGKEVISWNGKPEEPFFLASVALPNICAVGVKSNNAKLEIHELQVRLQPGARGYRLNDDDWKNPLNNVAGKPSAEIAEKCLEWKGKRYFISDKPMKFASAQRMAKEFEGRLLTISSHEEETFISDNSHGRTLWMSGWRPPYAGLSWRDERNRPLKYVGNWAPNQPDHDDNVEWNLSWSPKEVLNGWNDVSTRADGIHACIEWGEEDTDEPKFLMTKSGLKYRFISRGSDNKNKGIPTSSNTVEFHSRGWLDDGSEFENTRHKGRPVTFSMSPSSELIPGVQEGLKLMAVGDTIELEVPTKLGYGRIGRSPTVPPDATLHYEIELKAVH